LSLLTLGLEKDRSTPSSSSLDSSVAPRNSSRSLRLGDAVVGEEDQRRLSALVGAKALGPTTALSQAGPLHQLSSDLC